MEIFFTNTFFQTQTNYMAHLLSMDLYQVVVRRDDNFFWRKFTHVNSKLECVSNGLDFPRGIRMAWNIIVIYNLYNLTKIEMWIYRFLKNA